MEVFQNKWPERTASRMNNRNDNRREKMRKIIVTSLMLMLITSIPQANAAGKKFEAKDYIKFRQSAMMYLRWNMAVIKKNAIKQPEKYNRDAVVAAARTISAIAGSGMENLYPEKTKTGKGWKETRVKKEYFEKPDDVKDKILKLVNESNQLLSVARSDGPAEVAMQFKKVLNSCKSCHKAYRSK